MKGNRLRGATQPVKRLPGSGPARWWRSKPLRRCYCGSSTARALRYSPGTIMPYMRANRTFAWRT